MWDRRRMGRAGSGSRWRVPTGALGVLATVLLAGPSAQALDFDTSDLLYQETYTGETTSPTSPEADTISLGGLSQGGAVTLTGTVAQVDAPCCGPSTGGIMWSASPSTSTHGAADVGARAYFDDLTIAGDGTIQATVGVEVNDSTIVAGIRLTRSGSTDSALFRLLEGFGGTEALLALTTAETTALLGGAPFTVDLFIDRTAETAIASVQIDGFAETTTAPMALTYGAATGFELVLQSGGFLPDEPIGMTVAMTGVELYGSLNPLAVPALGPVAVVVLVTGIALAAGVART